MLPDCCARLVAVAHDLCGQSIVVDRGGCPLDYVRDGTDEGVAAFVPVLGVSVFELAAKAVGRRFWGAGGCWRRFANHGTEPAAWLGLVHG